MRLNYQRQLWRHVGGVLLGLAGCQPQQPAQSQASAAAPAPHAPASPAPPRPVAAPSVAATAVAAAAAADGAPHERPSTESQRAVPGPRRYVGTVGGQPATAELRWAPPDALVGRFYLWRRPGEYQLASPARRSPHLLAVARDWPDSTQASGQWQLTQPPGAVLQGTWVDATGRRQPFVLHEDYQGGVRYEILTSTLTLPVVEQQGRAPEYSHDFLRLLGPAAGRLPLRRAQCPPPARRRQLVRNFPHDGEVICTYDIEVLLNDFHLLSYRTQGLIDPFEGQNDWELLTKLVDLDTGRELTLASQLRPGYERPLRRLLTHHLRHDPAFDDVNSAPANGWQWQDAQGAPTPLVPLPGKGEGLVLTTQGLEATYYDDTLHGGPFTLVYPAVRIPYRELRPLVRPGTPLARMLRARGM